MKIGVEIDFRNVTIGDKNFRIQNRDTAEQEHTTSEIRTYYQNYESALILYYLTNKESFRNILSSIEDFSSRSPIAIFKESMDIKFEMNDG